MKSKRIPFSGHKIGQVVKVLKDEFPDVSVSKLRFLEQEGLFMPSRTESKYRSYSEKDIKKIKAVLRLQKEKYLPLSVIKDKVKAIDRGEIELPELLESSGDEEVFKDQDMAPLSEKDVLRRTRANLALLEELETYKLIAPETIDNEKKFSPDEVQIIKLFNGLSKYGIEPRHLKMHRMLADNETVLLEQILLPELKQQGPAGKAAVKRKLNEIIKQIGDFRILLLSESLRRAFKNHL